MSTYATSNRVFGSFALKQVLALLPTTYKPSLSLHFVLRFWYLFCIFFWAHWFSGLFLIIQLSSYENNIIVIVWIVRLPAWTEFDCMSVIGLDWHLHNQIICTPSPGFKPFPISCSKTTWSKKSSNRIRSLKVATVYFPIK